MTKHSSPISSVASSSGYIATTGYDNKVILWEGSSKKFINRGSHDHLANYATFSPGGEYLLSAGSDYTARLWSLPDMKLLAVYSDHNDDVENAAFSNSGKYVATASRDHDVRIFSIEGLLLKVLKGHTADVLSVVWSGDDAELISSGDDGTIRIWNVADGTEKKRFNFDEVETDTCGIFKSFVYAGNDLGEINAINIRTEKLSEPIKAHTVGIKSIKINEGLRLLASSSYDRTVKLWKIDAETGGLTLHKEISAPSGIWLRAVNIVDENVLAFGTFGSCYALYYLDTGEWDFTGVDDTGGKNAVLSHNGNIYAVGDSGHIFRNGAGLAKAGSLCNFFLPVDDVVVTGGQTGELFDAATGNVIYRHYSPLNCGTSYVSEGIRYAVIGSYTGEGLVFRYNDSGLSFERSIKLHSNAIKGIASNGKTIFSVCANTDAAFHDAATLGLIRHIKQAHGLIANGADWAGSDTYVSVSRDLKLRIWGNTSLVEEVDSSHDHSIKCVRVSSTDPHLVATGSYSGLFSVYDIKQKKWGDRIKLSTSGISSISFSKEENAFLASSYDGNIYKVAV